MAIQRRRPGAGLIHHSDRGSQYAAGDYRDILQAAAIIQSMSRKANCWDNAPMESFFGTLKTELVHQREYPDRDAARRDLFAYIEGYYNASLRRGPPFLDRANGRRLGFRSRRGDRKCPQVRLWAQVWGSVGGTDRGLTI